MTILVTILTAVLAVWPLGNPQEDPAPHHLRASYYLREGKPEAALEEMQLAIEGDPDSSYLRVALGQVLLSLNRPQEAAKAAEKALELNGSSADAYRLLGQAYFQQLSRAGQDEFPDLLKKTESAFKRAAELDPDDQQSLYYLNHIYEVTGRDEEAVATKRRLLTLNPTNPSLWLRLADSLSAKGDREGELEALRQFLELESDNPQVLVRAGAASSALGRDREALAYFDQARSLLQKQGDKEPENLEIRLELGDLCLRHTGQYDIALQAFERAYELAGEQDPEAEEKKAEQARAALGKATALAAMQDFDPAAVVFEQFEDWVFTNYIDYLGSMLTAYARSGRAEKAESIVLLYRTRSGNDPQTTAFFERLRAQVMSDGGRHDEAVNILDTLISKNPDDVENYPALSNVLLQKKDYEGALAALDRAAGLSDTGQESENTLFSRSLILEQRGDYEAAKTILQNIIEKDPSNHIALNNLGYLLAEQNKDLDKALEYVGKAVEMQPYQGSYLDSLGWIHYLKGELEQAERYLTEAAKTNYNSPEVREHLGYLYSALGRPEQALKEFQAALEKDLASVKPTAEVEKEIERLRKMLEEK
jgi:tetratricopeptide (TPR) repeat protein